MTTSESKIHTLPSLLKQVSAWREAGEKIVFTNGCFDILHVGHVDYLEKASCFGSKMIVGLNTDLSVSVLKGPNRPVNPEYARLRVMAALGFVDAVVLFGEQTPYELIRAVLPDVLVKGSDYNISTIVGADVVMAAGGDVKTIDLVDGFSTTKTIEKMKRS
jgi:D-glycero-beta-D-manno-heptose 1-phosphate adenylyltransferase